MNANNPRNVLQLQEMSKATLRRRKRVIANAASTQHDKLDT